MLGRSAIPLHQAGYDVHGQREHRQVEEERGNTVHGRQSTDCLAGNLNVGHLCGHGHDERVIKEVPVVRVFLTRKNEAAGPLVVTLAKELACIVQGEDRVHESPGQQNCAQAQDDVVRVPRLSDLGYNRSETGEGCRRGEHQKRDRAFIIDGRPLPHPGNRRVRHERIDQRQIEHNAAVPADKKACRRAPGQGKQRQRNRGAERGRKDQARMQAPEPSEPLQLGWPLPT